MNKRTFLALSFMFFFLGPFSSSAPAQGQATESQSDEAIIVLSTVTVQEMLAAEDTLKKMGVEITNVFPPSVFWGRVPIQIFDSIKALSFVEAISSEALDASLFMDYEDATAQAIEVWNKRIDTGGAVESSQENPSGDVGSAFENDMRIPEGWPETLEEQQAQEEAYQKHWQQKKMQLQQEEELKKKNWEQKHLKKK